MNDSCVTKRKTDFILSTLPVSLKDLQALNKTEWWLQIMVCAYDTVHSLHSIGNTEGE